LISYAVSRIDKAETSFPSIKKNADITIICAITANQALLPGLQ